MNDTEIERVIRRAGYDVRRDDVPGGGATGVYALRDGKRHTRSQPSLLALAEYRYNWSIGETHRLCSERWLDAAAMRTLLIGLAKGAPSGDVYASSIDVPSPGGFPDSARAISPAAAK